MRKIWRAAGTAVLLAGAALPAAGSSSGSPFRHGFPDPPLYSYNPHLYWSYGARYPALDRRTLTPWQSYSGPDGSSAIHPGSYGSPAAAARIQKGFGPPLPPGTDAPYSPVPFTW